VREPLRDSTKDVVREWTSKRMGTALNSRAQSFGRTGSPSMAQLARNELRGIGPLVGCFVSVVSPALGLNVDSPLMPIRDCEVTLFGIDGPASVPIPFARGEFERLDLESQMEQKGELHVVRARDTVRGGEINRAHVFFGPPGAMLAAGAPAGRHWAMPRSTRVAFSVWARGYRPVFGDASSFEAGVDDGKEARTADVKLSAGLGAQLFFRARDERTNGVSRWPVALLAAPPIPGVEVEGLGNHADCSDEGGELRITADAEVTLTLRAKGWKLDDLEIIDPSTNAWIVWMKSTAR
jgi:hypothetical protein